MNDADNANGIILEVAELRKHFPIRSGFFQRVSGWVKAVNGVDFRIPAGQTLGLVGESGCGKSTVARMIMGLLPPDSGRIRYRGAEIADLTEKQRRPFRKQMQIVFQDPYGSLNPRMTVGQSIEEGLRILGISRGTPRRDRLAELLEMVGLAADTADRYPHEFSGGQRQRIGIARALSVEPSLVICDEPISALDVSIQAQIINLLKDLQEQLGLSYLFISHDLNVVGYLCNHVAVMYQGFIMEYAPAETLFADPLHPYTQTLLAAIPEPEPKDRQPFSEVQERPELPPVPEQCAFRERCPDGDEDCRSERLSLQQVSSEHWVRCWRVADNGGPDMVPDI